MSFRQKLLETRFLMPGETEDEMFKRVAYAVVGYDKVLATCCYEYMRTGTFLPNSPTLANAGTNRRGTLSACFVLPLEDSLEGIYRAVWEAAQVHAYFGGTGFDLTPLRQAGSLIRSTGGKACGPIRVMELLNQSSEVVAQGGKRQGANMGILASDHPDIHDFIHCKDDEGRLRHFNISVSFTDEQFRKSPELVREVATHAWRSGDPGVLFVDTINRDNPTPSLGRIVATNPCGEQPLLPYESCNLGSINLAQFASSGAFDYGRFEVVVGHAVRFLDSVIDVNCFPLPLIEERTKLTRKVGLGVMGWADCLIKMGVRYCSNEALVLIDQIGECLSNAAWKASEMMVREEGREPYAPGESVRNATVTTIAPTGTLSYLARCSSGIEPNYAWRHVRTSEAGTEEIMHPLWKIVEGSYFMADTALHISPEWHIKHQATFQEWIDNAVSKTINMPADATVEDVLEAYSLAFSSGCKGITIYRDGSKREQVLTTISDAPIKRRPGHTYEWMSGCGTIYVTVNRPNEGSSTLFEVFVRTAGGCEASNETHGRLVSGWLQAGGHADQISKILSKVKCVNAIKNPKSEGKSCADLIAESIRLEGASEQIVKLKVQAPESVCPECGETMVMQEGCGTGVCQVCGWSGCS